MMILSISTLKEKKKKKKKNSFYKKQLLKLLPIYERYIDFNIITIILIVKFFLYYFIIF
jgi:hypothetical protein